MSEQRKPEWVSVASAGAALRHARKGISCVITHPTRESRVGRTPLAVQRSLAGLRAAARLIMRNRFPRGQGGGYVPGCIFHARHM
ncbi:MAG: hypothetical protein ACLQPD_29335 [Desulfomonilaceae bacterium]